MKKILIILISIFTLSGCTVYYDLNIDENLIITENIKYIEPNLTFSEDSNMQKKDYLELLNNIKESARENNYEFIDKTVGNNVNINLIKKTPFQNLKDPFFLKGKYENFNTTCTEKFCSLTASVIENTIIGDGDILYFNIGISLPYEVIKNNASFYDEKNNVYYWYHSPIDEQKNIEIVFKNGGENIIKANARKTKTNLIIWVIIGLLITTGIGAIGYKIYKSNKASL